MCEGEKERGGVARLRRKSGAGAGAGEEEGEGDIAREGGILPSEGEETIPALAEERRLGVETNAGFGEPLRAPKRADGMPGLEGIGDRIPDWEGELPAE